jgi:hypothetical protein
MNYEYLSYGNYGILKGENLRYYDEKYYEIWVGKIIALNGEGNEKK